MHNALHELSETVYGMTGAHDEEEGSFTSSSSLSLCTPGMIIIIRRPGET